MSIIFPTTVTAAATPVSELETVQSCDCKDDIELLGVWLRDVKKISTDGASENLVRFQALIKSFPIVPKLPEEIVHLRKRIALMVVEGRAYFKELEKMAEASLAAFKAQYCTKSG